MRWDIVNKTLWPLAGHTLGKHEVLRRYLNAWFPIMSSGNERILFIDGFAGPGQYTGGEDGSPVIALRSLLGHRTVLGETREIGFVFIEKDPARAKFLEAVTDKFKSQLPKKVSLKVISGVFDQTLTETLNHLDAESLRLAPSFVMIDPFGVSDTPMSVIHRILQHPKSEVYVSVMTRDIRRFLSTKEFDSHLTDLFGGDSWKTALNIDNEDGKLDHIFSLYKTQLKNAGAKYVLRFDLFDGRQLIYSIFFATQSLIGCNRMKQAIWNVDKWGNYEFRASKKGQLQMDLASPDLTKFQDELVDKFGAMDEVDIREIEDYSKSDMTDFHSGHLKRLTLIPMEKTERLRVLESPRARAFLYPPGTKLRFLK